MREFLSSCNQVIVIFIFGLVWAIQNSFRLTKKKIKGITLFNGIRIKEIAYTFYFSTQNLFFSLYFLLFSCTDLDD